MSSDPVSELQSMLDQKLDNFVTVNGKSFTNGNLTISAVDVGLGNVDNVRDIDKQISTSTQDALDAKADKSLLVCGHPLSGNIDLTRADIQGLDKVDNISDMDKPISVATQRALDTKMSKYVSVCGHVLSSDVFLSKSDVGLANVDNTSDADKPISRATQVSLRALQASVTASVNQATTLSNRMGGYVPLSRRVCGYDLSTDVNLDKSDVGLANVDNVPDMAKPVSAAMQAALDLKSNKSVTINGYSLSADVSLDKADVGLANVDNTNDANKPVSGPVQAALNLKVNKSTMINGHSLDSNVSIDKADVGLGSVDNTSDANKPVSGPVNVALNLKENLANKNIANGYAGLDASGKLFLNQMPISGLSYKGTWNAATNNPVLTSSAGSAGEYYKVSAPGTVSLNDVSSWALGDWAIYNGFSWQKITNTDAVSSVNGRSGAVWILKNDVGLGNVDNTSDVNKPVSTMQQASLDMKADKNVKVNGYALSSDVLLSKSDVGLANVDNTSDENKPLSLSTRTALTSKVDKSTTVNGYLLGANVTLVKSDVGLGNADNTSDVNKPVSAAQQVALDLKENRANKNTANGYAGLDASGKLSLMQMPITGLSYKGTWNASSNSPALSSGNAGDYYKVSVSGSTSVGGITDWKVGDWAIYNGTDWDKIDNTDQVSSVNGYVGAVVLSKSDVGLSNSDNTSDANKPVSVAQQTALNNKADKSTTINGYALSSNVVLSKSDVGLSNADNTSDANKPVSVAQQAALNSKQNTLVSGTNIKTINGGSLLGNGDIVVTSDIKNVVFNGVSQSLSGLGKVDLQPTYSLSFWIDPPMNAVPVGSMYNTQVSDKTLSNGVTINYVDDNTIDVVATGMFKLVLTYSGYFSSWPGGNFIVTANVTEIESGVNVSKALSFSIAGYGSGYGRQWDTLEANLPLTRQTNWTSTYRITLLFNDSLKVWGGCVGLRLI